MTEVQSQWVSSAYNLSYGWWASQPSSAAVVDMIFSGLLFAGRMADIFGRKLLFLLGMGITLVFNIISAVIPVSLATDSTIGTL